MKNQEKIITEAAKEAVHNSYRCIAVHPCPALSKCCFGKGSNSAYSCNECCADDFKIGFKAGVEWVAKQYKDAPWNEFVDMIINERQKGK